MLPVTSVIALRLFGCMVRVLYPQVAVNAGALAYCIVGYYCPGT
jgi:hypothetical protein